MAAGKKKGLVVDFSKEEEGGGGRFRVPEGDYKFKVVKVEPKESKQGNPMLVFTFQGVEGKVKGKTFRDYFALTPKALWKLRGCLEAMGISVPKSKVNIPMNKLIGKEVGVTLADDEYEGKISSKPADYIDLDTLAGNDVDDDEDDDDADEDDSDSDDDDDEEDLEDLDLEDL